MYIQIRITPEFCGVPELLNDKSRVINELLQKFGQYGDVEFYAACTEDQNKFGEPTNYHMHFNLVLDDHIQEFRKDSFQAWFRRRPYLPKGNKCYSISIVGDPEDEDRWWRYLLKQESNGLTIGLFKNKFPQEFLDELDMHTALAQDERKLQIQRNIAARDRALQNDSFRLRAYNYINENFGETELTARKIFCELIRYYMQNNKVPPFNTMMNMVLDFKVHFGLMTPEDYFDTIYQN